MTVEFCLPGLKIRIQKAAVVVLLLISVLAAGESQDIPSTSKSTEPSTTPSTQQPTTQATTAGTTVTTTAQTTVAPPRPTPIPEGGLGIIASIEPGDHKSYAIQLPEHGLTAELKMLEGNISCYYSYKNSDPNAHDNDGILVPDQVVNFAKPTSILEDNDAVVYVGVLGHETKDTYMLTIRRVKKSEPSSATSLSIPATCLLLSVFGMYAKFAFI